MRTYKTSIIQKKIKKENNLLKIVSKISNMWYNYIILMKIMGKPEYLHLLDNLWFPALICILKVKTVPAFCDLP